jgi:nucleoid DNA-binding protein
VARRQIAQKIAKEMGLTQEQTKEVIRKLFDGVVRSLAEEGRMELRNFGVFAVKRRKPRRARNPRTGEKVMVPARLTVTFQPGLAMQQRVESLGKEDPATPSG